MILLAILKLLEDNGFGAIDHNLFLQKIGLGGSGLFISSIGSEHDRGQRRLQRYEIFAVDKSPIEGLKKIESVAEFLSSSFELNELPEIEGMKFKNITIMPASTITSLGENEQGLAVYSISGKIYY